jgi:molecular chaperone GrpE
VGHEENVQDDEQPEEGEFTSKDESETEAEAGEQGGAAQEEDQPESLEDRLEHAQAEAAEYLDGWQRARAEFANYKKRMERETEEARARVTGEVITRYLSVLDDLERALERAPEDKACQEWVSGIELIRQKLAALLEAEGVEVIVAEGERFDPMLHEAISYEESEEHEEGSVIEVTQRGYKLGERILRPAMVRVAR